MRQYQKRSKKKTDMTTQVYSLSAEKLLELLNEDPEFKRCVTLRATKRRAHFLSIQKEVESYVELSMKYGYDDLGEDPALIGRIFGDEALVSARPEQGDRRRDEALSARNPLSQELAKDPYARHSQQELEEALHINVKTKIGRVLRDLKKMTFYKNYDPYSLRVVVKTIDYGYNTLTQQETSDVTKVSVPNEKSIQTLFNYSSIINQTMV